MQSKVGHHKDEFLASLFILSASCEMYPFPFQVVWTKHLGHTTKTNDPMSRLLIENTCMCLSLNKKASLLRQKKKAGLYWKVFAGPDRKESQEHKLGEEQRYLQK